jgi:hypothetical protein
MNWDKVDKILTNVKDYHVPVYTGMFCLGSVLQWFHHLDTTFVAFTATILGALTGHAFSPAQRNGDGGNDGHHDDHV